MIYNFDPHQKIKVRAHVVIESSSELHELNMDDFVGMEGMVTSLVKKYKRLRGAWVRILGGAYDSEEWYFPILSLRDVNAKSLSEEFGDFII